MTISSQLAALMLLVMSTATACADTAAPKNPNILYLMSDDMRPQLGCYGHSYMKTPNIDALAKTGLQFDFAYTQFAYCAPSRNSFLSGRRPDRTRALNFLTTFRERPGGQNWTAMPQFFKKLGYFTSSAGKIYHDGMDDPPSWSYPSNQTKWIGCHQGDMIDKLNNYCGVTNASQTQYTDEDLVMIEGLKRLELAKQSGKPWWVSMGVHRPHTEYRVPDGFYGHQVYPDGVTAPKHPGPPSNVPYMAGNWHDGDINDPAHGCPSCIVPANRSIEYRRWYYAAVTWADHNLGMTIDKLKEIGEENNTIIVFHSDHGYQLGELNEWSKKTDTELAVHVPLIVYVPWKQNSHGKRTTVKAELIDLYKTLADLSGNLDKVEDGVQGTSLAPVFDSPENPPHDLASKRAYSQIGRCSCQLFPEYNVTECDANACAKVPLGQFEFMGYTMRTDKYRFTAWVHFDNSTMRVDWNKTAALELYDLTSDDGRNFDFDGYSHNLAKESQYADLVAQYRQNLQQAVDTWY